VTYFSPLVYQVNADAARPYFDHPSQRKGGMIDPAALHDNGIEYWFCDGVCGTAHPSLWPGVWMIHIGAKPERWGYVDGPCRAMLEAFWDAKKPDRVTAWVKANNRAVLALTKRLGFETDGRMVLASGEVIMLGWRP